MKKPSKKKEMLIWGIAGAVVLTGGAILTIHVVVPNGCEQFLYDATGVALDINNDGMTPLDYTEIPMNTDDAYGPRTDVGLGGYEEFAY